MPGMGLEAAYAPWPLRFYGCEPSAAAVRTTAVGEGEAERPWVAAPITNYLFSLCKI